MVMAGSGQAAVIYWDVNTATATTWGATSSWSTSATVADQAPAAVPTTGDSVVFGLSSITNTNLTVNLGAARSVIGMEFLGTNAGTTLMQAGGTNFGLTLGTGGVSIASGSGAVTIGSATNGQQVAVTLGAAQTWRNDSSSAFTVVNGIANGGNLLTVLGSGNSVFSGVLSGTGGLTKNGAGILTLSGSNTYTGATTVSNGTLRLDYATNNNDKLGTTLVFGGGTIDLSGGSFAQTVTSSTISAGASEVTRGSGTSTLGLGTLTRTAGATLNLASGVATTGTANVNGIVGAYATVGGADWATGTTSITGLAAGSYTAFGAGVSGATTNYSGTAGVTRSAALTFNTIKLASSAGTAQTLALGANNMSMGGATSGLLFTGSDAWTISGTGNIRTSANNTASELIIHQYNTGGLTITAPMVDRGTGALSVTKTGTGLLTLSGSKTYTGTTTLNEGTLVATGNAGALGAGTLAILGGVLELANDTGLTFGRNTTVSADATIKTDRVAAGAGVTHTLGALSIGGQTLTVDRDGTVTSGTAGLTFGATTLSASGTTFNVNSAGTLLTLGAVTGTNTSFSVSGAGDATFSGIVGTGTGTVSKSGTGRLTLSGANTYTGAMTISEGVVNAQNATALGTTAGGVTVANGAALEVQGGVTIGAETLSITGSGVSSGGALRNVSGVNVYGGAVTVGAGTSIGVDAGSLSLTGGIGNGLGSALTKAGAGTLIINSADSLTGIHTINGGTLQLGASGSIQTVAMTLGSGTTFDLNGRNATLGAAGNLNVRLTEALISTGAGTLSLTNGTTVTSNAGATSSQITGNLNLNAGTPVFAVGDGGAADDLVIGAVISNGSLVKNGAGAMVFSGANTYSGTTVINDGTIRLTGSGNFGSGSAVTVAADGSSGTAAILDLNELSATIGSLTLGGTSGAGLVSNTVQTGAGTLTLGGNVLFNGDLGNQGTNSITGNLNLGGATRAFTTNGAGKTLGVSAVISNGTMSKDGVGTLTLSGNNSFAGGLSASAGVLRATTSVNALGAGTLALSGAALELANDSGLNFARNTTVSANTSVKSDVSTVGANGVVHSMGTLNIGANTLSLTAGGNVLAGSNYGLTFGATTVAAGSVFDVANNVAGTGTLTLGALTGNVNFTKQGAGVLALSGASARTSGVTTVSAGTLRLGSTSALGTTGASVSLSGGGSLDLATDTTVNAYNVALEGDASIVSNKATAASAGITHTLGTLTMGANTLSVSRGANATGTGSVSTGAVSLSAGGGVFDAAANSSLSLASVSGTNTAFSIGGAGTTAVSGVIGTGTGGVTKTGAGTLTLSGANTYTGTTTISGGTLAAGAGNVISTSSVVDVASGASFNLANFNQSVGGVTGAGNVTLGNGTLTIGGAGLFGTYSGAMTGTGALVKAGAAESMFSGVSTFSGGTTVQAGTLQLTGTGTLGSAVTVNGSGAKFYQTSSVKGPNVVLQTGEVTIDGTSRSVGSLTVSGGTISNGPGAAAPVLTADSAAFSGSATINLTISGNTTAGLALVGGLTGPGSGTVSINPTNLAGSWANGTYDLISYGGSISNFSGFALGTVTGKGGRQAAVLSNPTGKLMLTMSGSTVTYTGSGGGDWTMNNAGAANFKLTGDNTVTNFRTADTAVFDNTASNQTLNIVDNIDAAALTFSSGNYVINSSGGKKITGSTSIVVNGATLTLNTSNDYTGTVQLNSGRINLGNANGLGSTDGTNGAIDFGNNVTLSNTSGGALTTPNYPLNFNGQLNVVGASNLNLGSGLASLVANSSVNVETATVTLGGVVDASGAQTFEKTGAGVLVMSGSSANGYDGQTTVSGGTLALGKSAEVLSINGDIVIGDGIGTDTLRTDAAGQIASAASLTFNAAGSPVFDLSGNNQAVGRLSSTNTGAAVSLGAGTLTVGGVDKSGEFAGVISGTGGGLTKVGTGTLTVSGANSYTGTTTISAGTLQVGAGGTSGVLGSGGVTNNATLSFNRSDALTVSSAISGTGAVVQNGAGTLTLAGTNSYTGALTINGGVVSAATAGINGGSVTNGVVFNGGTLRAASGGITTAKAVAMTGAGGVDTNGNAVDLSGAFSGSGVLTKSGTGTLTVSNASNSFAGGISVTGGVLKATVPGALGLASGAGAIALASGSVLQLDGSGEDAVTGNGIANVISGAGGILRTFMTGTAGLSITGTSANTFSGLTQVDSGTLRLQKTSGVNAIGGDALVNGGTLILRAGEQIPNGSTVTVSSGTLEYPNTAGVTSFFTETVGTIVASGGAVNTRGGSISTGVLSITGSGAAVGVNGYLASAQRGALTVSGSLEFSAAATLTVAEAGSGSANTLNLGGGITTTHTSGTAVIATGSGAVPGEMNLGSGSRVIAVGNGSGATDLEISARMTGSGGGISKTGLGTLELTGSAVNDYGGATTVAGGVLKLSKSGSGNGSVPGSLAVTSGGTVQIAASEQVGDTSAVTLGSGAVFSFNGTGLTETVGTFTNSGGDFSTGANSLVGTGNSIYWEGGSSTINDGGSVSDQHFLVTGGANTVEAGGVMNVLNGGTGLEFGGTSGPTILLNASDALAGKIVLSGNVVADVASGTAAILSSGTGSNPGSIVMGGGTRTVTVSNGSAGTDLLVSARMSDGSLIKAGAGTLELGAVNSLTGLTVNAGTVLFGVDNAVTGNVTLGGGTLALGGKDASAGVFTLSSASVLDMGGYAGSFTGSGAGLSSILSFANTNATDGWAGLRIFNWDGVSFTGGGNDEILFSSFSGSQTVFNSSQVQFYSDAGTTEIGTGGELVTSSGGGWELVPVPEPSTVVGVLGLIGMAAWRERRYLLRCPEAVAEVRVRVG